MSDPTPSWADHIREENNAVELQHGEEAGSEAAKTVWPSSEPARPEHSPLHEVGVDLVEGGAVGTGAGAATVIASGAALSGEGFAGTAALGLGLGAAGLAAAGVGAGLLAYEAVTDGPLNAPLVAAGEGISHALDPVLDPVLSRVADAEDYVADATGHAYDAVFGDDPGEQPPQ